MTCRLEKVDSASQGLPIRYTDCDGFYVYLEQNKMVEDSKSSDYRLRLVIGPGEGECLAAVSHHYGQ